VPTSLNNSAYGRITLLERSEKVGKESAGRLASPHVRQKLLVLQRQASPKHVGGGGGGGGGGGDGGGEPGFSHVVGNDFCRCA